MTKRFNNILSKIRKKNKTIILAASLGVLVGCSVTKEGSNPLETEDVEIIDIQAEESLPESGQLWDDCSILIGDVSLSIYENKQDILAKLDGAGWDYSEFEPDNPGENKFDTCYSIGGWMQMYFLDDVCVRLMVIDVDGSDQIVQTARSVCPGSTYTQMVEQYGDDYETHAYAGKEVYKIYQYAINDYICEFGIPGENRDLIYNIDLYVTSQAPIYEYGEELR